MLFQSHTSIALTPKLLHTFTFSGPFWNFSSLIVPLFLFFPSLIILWFSWMANDSPWRHLISFHDCSQVITFFFYYRKNRIDYGERQQTSLQHEPTWAWCDILPTDRFVFNIEYNILSPSHLSTAAILWNMNWCWHRIHYVKACICVYERQWKRWVRLTHCEEEHSDHRQLKVRVLLLTNGRHKL